MSSSTQEPDALRHQANELYWSSDATVLEIVGQMQISRSALYDLVDPLPVGGPCPRCGGALAFTNRSARSAGRATCERCGHEVATEYEPGIDSTGELTDAARPSQIGEARQRLAGIDWTLGQYTAGSPVSSHALALGALALFGAAIGVAAVHTYRERR